MCASHNFGENLDTAIDAVYIVIDLSCSCHYITFRSIGITDQAEKTRSSGWHMIPDFA